MPLVNEPGFSPDWTKANDKWNRKEDQNHPPECFDYKNDDSDGKNRLNHLNETITNR